MFAKRIGLYLLCLSVMVTAGCGGGGGGAASQAASPPSGNNQQPPPLPTPVYQGMETPAPLSPFTAGQVTAFVFADVDIAISFSENLVSPSMSGTGPISQTQSGPLGGQVVLTGYVDDQNGWATETFTNYAFTPANATAPVTLNGELLVEVSNGIVTYGYTNYSIQGSGFDTVLSGNASQVASSGIESNGQASTTLNLGILDRISGIDEELVNFTLNSVNGAEIGNSNKTLIDRTFSGRVFDSAAGYVDIATQGTQHYSPDPTKLLPLYGANVKVTGSSSTTPLMIGPLNYYFFAVGISTNNNGVFNASARYDWNGFAADTTPAPVGTGPVAIAEEATTPAVGVPITLDGRFSHSPNGDYLQMQWSLLYVTPGSHPVLADANMPEATLTVDKAGDYLLLLTVSDDGRTSQDTVTVSIPSDEIQTESTPMAQSVAGPDVTGQIGIPVLLDGRASFDTFNDGNAPTYNWALIAPPGSKAVLSSATSAQPSFTPDIPGYYHVLLNPATVYLNVDPDPSAQSLTVTVDEPIAFRPPVQFDGSLNNGGRAFEVADINGDGVPDVVLYPGNISDQVNVYLSAGSGRFGAPEVLMLPAQQATQIYAATDDLNNDGRLDLVVSGENANIQGAVFVYLQNPDGSFSTPEIYSYGANTGVASPVAIGHLFGSSALSTVVFGYGGLCDFPVNSNGTLQTPSSISLPPFSGAPFEDQFALLDFNGDGLADIVSGELYTANSNNTFSVFDNQNSSSTEAAYAADLYGDGHNELIITDQNSLQVFSEAGINPVSYPLTVGSDPATGDGPTAVGVGDLGNNGLGDIVLTYFGDCNTYGDGVCFHDLGLFFQQANRSFGPEVAMPVDESRAAGPVWVGDINGDGVPDLMYTIGGQPVIQFGYKP